MQTIQISTKHTYITAMASYFSIAIRKAIDPPWLSAQFSHRRSLLSSLQINILHTMYVKRLTALTVRGDL